VAIVEDEHAHEGWRHSRDSPAADSRPARHRRRRLVRLAFVQAGGQVFRALRDDDTVLVAHLRSFEDRDGLLENEPSAFFTTDHYRNYKTVVVRLARVKPGLLKEILTDAWRRTAPRKLLKEHGEI
jgi:hypothetical protein